MNLKNEDEVLLALNSAASYLKSQAHVAEHKPNYCSGCTTLYLVENGIRVYRERLERTGILESTTAT